jgi:hypothetical protein
MKKSILEIYKAVELWNCGIENTKLILFYYQHFTAIYSYLVGTPMNIEFPSSHGAAKQHEGLS